MPSAKSWVDSTVPRVMSPSPESTSDSAAPVSMEGLAPVMVSAPPSLSMARVSMLEPLTVSFWMVTGAAPLTVRVAVSRAALVELKVTLPPMVKADVACTSMFSRLLSILPRTPSLSSGVMLPVMALLLPVPLEIRVSLLNLSAIRPVPGVKASSTRLPLMTAPAMLPLASVSGSVPSPWNVICRLRTSRPASDALKATIPAGVCTPGSMTTTRWMSDT